LSSNIVNLNQADVLFETWLIIVYMTIFKHFNIVHGSKLSDGLITQGRFEFNSQRIDWISIDTYIWADVSGPLNF